MARSVPQSSLQTLNPILGLLPSRVSKRYSRTCQQHCQRTSPAQIVPKRHITLLSLTFRLLLLAQSPPFNPCVGQHLSVGRLVLSKNYHCYIISFKTSRWPNAYRGFSECQHCNFYGNHNVEESSPSQVRFLNLVTGLTALSKPFYFICRSRVLLFLNL